MNDDSYNPYRQPQVTTVSSSAPRQGKDQTLAVISFVLGICAATIGCCCWLHVPLSIAAIITGLLGISKARQGTGEGYGLALTGVIVGGIVIVVYTVLGLLPLFMNFAINEGTFF